MKALGADNYFAHPYCSRKHGLNGNNNGLMHQYLPKGMTFDNVKVKKIKAIQNKLKNRHRKLLDYKILNEVYDTMSLATY